MKVVDIIKEFEKGNYSVSGYIGFTPYETFIEDQVKILIEYTQSLEQELDNVHEYLSESPSGMDGFDAWVEVQGERS